MLIWLDHCLMSTVVNLLCRSFRELIRLPLANINALKCVMHCLYKESLLFNDDEPSALEIMHNALQQSLEFSLLADISVDSDGFFVSHAQSKQSSPCEGKSFFCTHAFGIL